MPNLLDVFSPYDPILLSGLALSFIRHHRSYSPSPSTIFLVWRLWNCSSLVPVLPIIQILLCQSFWPLLPTSSSLLRCPSGLRPGPITFYPLYHTPKPRT